jgi:hypothetical protein
MKNIFEKNFAFLIDDPSFSLEKVEEFDGQDFRIIFLFRDVRFKLESDREQIGLCVASTYYPDREVDIVNLISFCGEKIKYQFYESIENLTERYKMQIEWLSSVVKENLKQIIEFCSPKDYLNNCQRLREYMFKTYPSLFVGLEP